jgi:hypothetical protein
MNNGWFLKIILNFFVLTLFVKLSKADQITTCQKNFYFDTTLQECKACPANSVSDGSKYYNSRKRMSMSNGF